MATLYEPAGETVLVGGDFYDWFVLPNGHVLVVVGDVSGKGPLAGALGMSIRKALKGAAWVTGDPAAALAVLQDALADEFAGSFATLVLVELVPGVGRVRLVLAGHPAPWVRRGERFAEVDAPPNAVLGPGVVHRWDGVDLELQPGDQLFLFTDGLTEARVTDGGGQFGDGPLQQLLAGMPRGLSSYETVLATYDALRDATVALSDDVVLGVLAFRPPPRTGRGRAGRAA
jgi:serine phosphatase RsbU (regulator of sigma subunit)